MLGDAIHNFVDGVLIGAAFLTDIHLGIVTSLAVVAHEIPQEVGDFAILLQSGYAIRGTVMEYTGQYYNGIGGVMAYFSLSEQDNLLPYLLCSHVIEIKRLYKSISLRYHSVHVYRSRPKSQLPARHPAPGRLA